VPSSARSNADAVARSGLLQIDSRRECHVLPWQSLRSIPIGVPFTRARPF
jgi:hypothetical protein